MTINRNNYEEFLLLYIDGELLPQQQKEVENFLELNADIQQELNDLLDTKLQLEQVDFGDISTLLRNEDAINKNNYQEHFLLFVDNEVNNQQKQATETFVLQHPELQNEFIAIQQTKLPIETIECPDKEELYKRERKAIVFYIQRMAVAAVFIGFGAFAYKWFEVNKDSKNVSINEYAATTNDVKDAANNQTASKENIVTSIVNDAAIKKNNSIASVNTTSKSIEKKLNKKIANAVTNNVIEPLNTQQTVETLANTNNTSQEDNKPINSVVTLEAKPINTNAIATTTSNTITTNTATTIVYKTLEDDDVSDEPTKKSKLKNLLKKAAKLITPKETSDDESKKIFAVTL